MTKEENDLKKEIKQLTHQIIMIQDKINAIHQLSPRIKELDEVFVIIEKIFSGELEDPKVDKDQRRP